MTIPKWHELTAPLLQFAAEVPEFRLADAVAVLADRLNLSEDDRAQRIPSGQFTNIQDRTNWALYTLKRVGMVQRLRRGVYSITSAGNKALLGNSADIEGRYLENLARKGDSRLNNIKNTPETPLIPNANTPIEVIFSAIDNLNSAVREEIIQRVSNLSPSFFERLVVQLLVAMGYRGDGKSLARAVGGRGDNGIDGVVDQDALGLDRVYIQAKRYGVGSTVGPDAIRDFFGSLDIAKASKGVFITTSSFTARAKETAERLGKRIVLIDGEQLASLMIRYDVGVRVEETLYMKKVDEDFFVE